MITASHNPVQVIRQLQLIRYLLSILPPHLLLFSSPLPSCFPLFPLFLLYSLVVLPPPHTLGTLHQDNGVKVVEPLGEMMVPEWEGFATQLANTRLDLKSVDSSSNPYLFLPCVAPMSFPLRSTLSSTLLAVTSHRKPK